MTTLTSESIEQHFQKIEHSILYDKDFYYGRKSSDSWMGICFEWKPQALKRGGKLKRNKAYGNIHYYYNGDELTREQAIAEVAKPVALRQALIEASTSIECSMCGLVVVGKNAMNPYTSYGFDNHGVFTKKPWGLVFWKMRDNNEPICLNFCPNCLQRIANGEFRET